MRKPRNKAEMTRDITKMIFTGNNGCRAESIALLGNNNINLGQWTETKLIVAILEKLANYTILPNSRLKYDN